ncbi:MAG TPA: hypothetical protein VED63_10530 [Acidimicrobiales bacterium]|nr:hypothetical protein [Acidimicrobiales bacterium]
MSPVCAAKGCENTVVRTNRRGRPPIYCSPRCRPGRQSALRRLVVEVDHEPVADDGRPVGRVWLVRLRRGQRSVVIAADLGRPSADHLAGEIAALITPRARGGGIG